MNDGDPPAFPIAPLWQRAAARLVDLALIAGLLAALLFVAHKLRAEEVWMSDGIVFLSIFAYEVLFPAFWKGQSPGKRVCGIRIFSESRHVPAGFVNCLGRFLARLAVYAIFAVFVVYEVSLPAAILVIVLEAVVGALHPRRQTIGDLVGRTLVAPRLAT